ncbi:hypothetical protein UA38_21970 [Photobacterium kishitanii]|uniref:Uncharacterized protein n=1 Tax=Photobacterium kishitanii TaxID=318456 RepID=A0AAX0YQ95_9GAMM|nr:type II toxin-antitoxin system RnlA family toxin [Photobacterium kishitanii]KJG55009.1 hypothetical protein UA38_21970 [Photobacterium kishitanii]KJG56559.1 hypothetical protein UA42_22330 [Photobacterium kishitanii]KJG63366.1 hypothetical protein UA40_22320 [Photobacterium kishitanii]KJG65330.1 hypothetical protein UA41_22210 [Photobacterium kishitanii]PSX15195.1 hypothetical protein C0W70_23000 [Photobacterium kishitanii]
MTNFKSLPLDQESIDQYLNIFVESNGYRVDLRTNYQAGSGNQIHRYIIGKALTPSATIDFICNKDGTTTIHYRLGKNTTLGLELAEYVKGQINPNEFESIEMTLQHIKEEDIVPLLRAINDDAYECGQKMFTLTEENNDAQLLQVRVRSVKHNDCLVLKHHKTKNSFQIQGRPLFVYKRLCYHFVDILDILGIEKVLNRQDESRIEMVSSEAAEHMLQCHYPNIFSRSPNDLKNLIISGMCITLSTPKLPDYSMLVYPDLRALEGALHDCFKAYGLYSSNFTDDGKERVGVMFRKLPNSTYTLRNEHVTTINCAAMVNALNAGYNQYAGKRHPLFHIEEELVFSTFISDLRVAISTIADTRGCIEELYKHRP